MLVHLAGAVLGAEPGLHVQAHLPGEEVSELGDPGGGVFGQDVLVVGVGVVAVGGVLDDLDPEFAVDRQVVLPGGAGDDHVGTDGDGGVDVQGVGLDE